MNLLQETSDYWKAISNENYEFDSKKKLIRFIESVTPEEVNQLFLQLFFENQKRLNIKIYSDNHLKKQDEMEIAFKYNQNYYENLKMSY